MMDSALVTVLSSVTYGYSERVMEGQLHSHSYGLCPFVTGTYFFLRTTNGIPRRTPLVSCM